VEPVEPVEPVEAVEAVDLARDRRTETAVDPRRGIA
jgi:hypothetical protein